MTWYCRGRFHRRRKKGKLENVTTWSHLPIHINYLPFAQQQWLRGACVLLVKQGDKPQLSLKSGKAPNSLSGIRISLCENSRVQRCFSSCVACADKKKHLLWDDIRGCLLCKHPAKTYHLWDHFSLLWSSLPTKPTALCTSVLPTTHREDALLALGKVTWLRGMYTEKPTLIGTGGVGWPCFKGCGTLSLLAAHVHPCLNCCNTGCNPEREKLRPGAVGNSNMPRLREGHSWALRQSTELSSSSTEIAFPPFQEKERMSLQQM